MTKPSKHSLYWCNVCMLHLQCKHGVFIDRGNPSLHQRLRNNRPIWLSIQSHPTCCQRIKPWIQWCIASVLPAELTGQTYDCENILYTWHQTGVSLLLSCCLSFDPAVCKLLSFTALSWLEYKWQRAVLVYGLFIHTAQVVLTGWSLGTPCPQSMMVITMVTLLPSPSPHLYTRLLFPVSLTLDLKNLNFQFRGILILWLSWGLFHYWWEISWARMIHWILHAVFPAITKGT